MQTDVHEEHKQRDSKPIESCMVQARITSTSSGTLPSEPGALKAIREGQENLSPRWPLYPSSPAFLSGQKSSVLSGSKPTFNVTKIHRTSNGPGDHDGFKAKLGVKWPQRLVKGGTSIKAKILCVGGTSGGTAWVPGDGHR